MEKFNLEKHWDGFLNERIAVVCFTEELANEFLRWCHSGGLKWNHTPFSLIENNNYDIYEEGTAYGIERNNFLYANYTAWGDFYKLVMFYGFN
jgi:hypothetical protein